jgi:hypothetical protein
MVGFSGKEEEGGDDKVEVIVRAKVEKSKLKQILKALGGADDGDDEEEKPGKQPK